MLSDSLKVSIDTKKSHIRNQSAHTMFIQQTRSDAVNRLNDEIDKLTLTSKPEDLPFFQESMSSFKQMFQQYINENDKDINWEKIQLLKDNRLINFTDITKPSDKLIRKALLDKLVVIKLNGGLGTSMGCTGPKSLITVRNDFTFLDLNIQQIENLNKKYNTNIPLVLMNSFNTQEETQPVLRKYQQLNVDIHTFEQSRYPRINRESLMPLPQRTDPWQDCAEGWYPPGHGDVYRSFVKSGLCEKFLKMGKQWVFISNIDNLAATISISILEFMDKSQSEFVMEVTEKTRADVKGGTLIEYEDKLRLLEIAQVPKDRVDDFISVRKFRIFNTNNLWISIPAINKIVRDNTIHMEIIVNPKTLPNGVNVLQLEEAVGAAIKSFQGAVGLKVPRTRFLPVKSTGDLLLLMSNLYQLKSGKIVLNKARNFSNVPLVKLGNQFRSVKNFLSRFDNIPNILELDHLTVSGDVTFGKDVQLRGTVIIIANHGERIDIPSGAILENKIVSGNLRILDH